MQLYIVTILPQGAPRRPNECKIRLMVPRRARPSVRDRVRPRACALIEARSIARYTSRHGSRTKLGPPLVVQQRPSRRQICHRPVDVQMMPQLCGDNARQRHIDHRTLDAAGPHRA
jgi:hypothetical protein